MDRETVLIGLLGGFRARLDDREVGDDRWLGRRSKELVQLLALADRHWLPREQVIEALWPHLGPAAGAANLRKAAHHARNALDSREAVVLRGGRVALFPSRRVATDAASFRRTAEAALATGDAAACEKAAAAYPGDLLPESLYEEWAQEPRRALQSLFVRLLAAGSQWERLVEVEPTDEAAYCQLMRSALDAGRRHAAIRWYGRLRTVLATSHRTLPSDATEALYAECIAGLSAAEPEFVGRHVELAEAATALRSAGRGELGAMLVRGAAGVGKSALCREVASLARDEAWSVVTVAASGDAEPYEPLTAAIEQLTERDATLFDAMPDRSRSVLAQLTPLAGPAPSLDGAPTRHQVIGAFRRLLQSCSDASGTALLLAVDDAHLADDATIEALHHLARSGASTLMIVLAYRHELAKATLAQGAAGLKRVGRAVEIDLGPLDDEETAALVTIGAPTKPGPGAVARIVELAEGNPFFTLELARCLVEDAPLQIVPTAWEAIALRFVDVDEGTAAMLARLAVAGDELDLDSVLALTGLSEPETFALLDSALEAGVLVVADVRYRFRHELVRQALAGRLPHHHRVAVHRDAARRLTDSGGSAGAIARHWLDGGRPEEAVEWLFLATRRAIELGAFSDALGHLDPLLEHQPDHIDALGLRAEVLDALGDGRAPDAYAAAALAVGEPESHEIKPKQALAQIKATDPAAALKTLEGVEPKTTAGLLCQALTLSAAAAIGWLPDKDLAASKAEEAYELAVELGESWAILDASWASALAAHSTGGLPDRLREYVHATRHHPELAIRVFDGQLCVTQRLLYGGLAYPEVIAFANSLAAEAERLDAARGRAFALTLRGEAELLCGRLDEADADLAEGARLHRDIGAMAGEALALQRRAEVAQYRGRPEEAGPLLAEALALAEHSFVGHHTLDRIYGTMVATSPDAPSALAKVQEAEVAIRGPAETCPTCRIAFVVPAAIAAARTQDHERAQRYATDVEGLTSIAALPPAWDASLEEVRGHLAGAAGDADAAAAHFARAAEGFRSHGHSLDSERCLAMIAT